MNGQITFEEEQNYFLEKHRAYPVNEIKDGNLYLGVNTRRGDVQFFVKENGSLTSIDAVVQTLKDKSIGLTSISQIQNRSSKILPTYPFGLYELREVSGLPEHIKELSLN